MSERCPSFGCGTLAGCRAPQHQLTVHGWCALQIQAVLDANILPPLVHLLATAEFDIKKEAAWALSNATSGGTADQIKFLVQCGCIKPLCDLLTCSDVRIVTVALEGLENILKIGEAQKELTGPQAVNVYAQVTSHVCA